MCPCSRLSWHHGELYLYPLSVSQYSTSNCSIVPGPYPSHCYLIGCRDHHRDVMKRWSSPTQSSRLWTMPWLASWTPSTPVSKQHWDPRPPTQAPHQLLLTAAPYRPLPIVAQVCLYIMCRAQPLSMLHPLGCDSTRSKWWAAAILGAH